MAEQNQYIGYVGTYTNGKSEGIYSFMLDTKAKKIEDVKVAAKIENPTYIAIGDDKRFLYSVAKEGENGGIASFSINPNGQLNFINSHVSQGAPPCYVGVNQELHTVLSANYHKGTIEASSLNPDGSIQSTSSISQHKGSGPDERQEKAHTHFSGFTPDGRFIIAVDLGIDKIITYSFKDGQLTKRNTLSVHPGSGPRHIVFHPRKPFAYVMTEFSSEVIVLQYLSEDGSFTVKQVISTIPIDFTGNNQGSAIHISKDGKYVYAGNRGHNSIAVFSVDEASNELNLIERVSTEGHWPRDFVLDPTEKFIVATNQESGNLVLFERNPESGKLALLQSDIAVPDPVCVKFL